jgi:integration host factor subunit beta
VTRSELIEEILAQSPSLSRLDVESIINTIFDTMSLSLGKHDRIEIRGLGTFVAKKRKARTARNPRTGQQVSVQDKWVPFFTAGKELRERVNLSGKMGEGAKSTPPNPSFNP